MDVKRRATKMLESLNHIYNKQFFTEIYQVRYKICFSPLNLIHTWIQYFSKQSCLSPSQFAILKLFIAVLIQMYKIKTLFH